MQSEFIAGSGTRVGVGVGVGEEVCVAIGVGEGEEVGVDIGVGTGVDAGAACFSTLPLLQINFFPDLTHVNLSPLYDLVLPCLAQVAPALIGLAEIEGSEDVINARHATASVSAIRLE